MCCLVSGRYSRRHPTCPRVALLVHCARTQLSYASCARVLCFVSLLHSDITLCGGGKWGGLSHFCVPLNPKCFRRQHRLTSMIWRIDGNNLHIETVIHFNDYFYIFKIISLILQCVNKSQGTNSNSIGSRSIRMSGHIKSQVNIRLSISFLKQAKPQFCPLTFG